MLTGIHISDEVSPGDGDYQNLRIGVRDDWPLLYSALRKAAESVSSEEKKALKENQSDSFEEHISKTSATLVEVLESVSKLDSRKQERSNPSTKKTIASNKLK